MTTIMHSSPSFSDISSEGDIPFAPPDTATSTLDPPRTVTTATTSSSCSPSDDEDEQAPIGHGHPRTWTVASSRSATSPEDAEEDDYGKPIPTKEANKEKFGWTLKNTPGLVNGHLRFQHKLAGGQNFTCRVRVGAYNGTPKESYDFYILSTGGVWVSVGAHTGPSSLSTALLEFAGHRNESVKKPWGKFNVCRGERGRLVGETLAVARRNTALAHGRIAWKSLEERSRGYEALQD